jgi:hypothetical protein
MTERKERRKDLLQEDFLAASPLTALHFVQDDK